MSDLREPGSQAGATRGSSCPQPTSEPRVADMNEDGAGPQGNTAFGSTPGNTTANKNPVR